MIDTARTRSARNVYTYQLGHTLNQFMYYKIYLMIALLTLPYTVQSTSGRTGIRKFYLARVKAVTIARTHLLCMNKD